MLNWSYNGGFFENYLCVGQMVASVAQAPLVPALHQQGGSVEPPESFAHQDEPGALSPCGAERKTGSKTGRKKVLLGAFS